MSALYKMFFWSIWDFEKYPRTFYRTSTYGSYMDRVCFLLPFPELCRTNLRCHLMSLFAVGCLMQLFRQLVDFFYSVLRLFTGLWRSDIFRVEGHHSGLGGKALSLHFYFINFTEFHILLHLLVNGHISRNRPKLDLNNRWVRLHSL